MNLSRINCTFLPKNPSQNSCPFLKYIMWNWSQWIFSQRNQQASFCLKRTSQNESLSMCSVANYTQKEEFWVPNSHIHYTAMDRSCLPRAYLPSNEGLTGSLSAGSRSFSHLQFLAASQLGPLLQLLFSWFARVSVVLMYSN